MGGFASAPQVRVNFFTEKGNIAASARIVDTRQKDQILSVTTNKDLKQPAGTFSIVLTGEPVGGGQFAETIPNSRKTLRGPGEQVIIQETTQHVRREPTFGWKDVLKPGDLVVIEMGPDRPQPTDTYYAKTFTEGLSGTTEVVMVGSIDDIQSTMTFGQDGRPTRTVTISGRDFGKYLIDDMVDFNPYFDTLGAYLGFLGQTKVEFPKGQLGGTPANVMDIVLRAWIFGMFDVEFDVSERGTVEKRGRLKLSQILRYVFDNSTPAIEFFQSWVFAEGAPWNLFEQVQSPPWYRLSLDCRRKRDIDAIMGYQSDRIDNNPPVTWNTNLSKFDTQVSLLYYRNPHSNRHYDDWTRLPTRVILPDDLVSENVGVSHNEVFNRWVVTPEVVGFNRVVQFGQNALREKELERRFGIRPRILKTPFISGRKFLKSNETPSSLVKRYTEMIRDWDLWNVVMLNGSLTIKGMAAVRCGDRLHYTPPARKGGIDYYVEGVRQEFVPFQGWTTTVAVTRGQRHRDVGEKLFDSVGNAIGNPPGAITEVAR